jgi:hypothetical protein
MEFLREQHGRDREGEKTSTAIKRLPKNVLVRDIGMPCYSPASHGNLLRTCSLIRITDIITENSINKHPLFLTIALCL